MNVRWPSSTTEPAIDYTANRFIVSGARSSCGGRLKIADPGNKIDFEFCWFLFQCAWVTNMNLRATIVVFWVVLLAMSSRAQPSNQLDHALKLDGANSYVELRADAFTNLTAATVEGWVKWDEFRENSRFFDFGETNHSINVQNRGGRPDLWFEIAHGVGNSNVTSVVAANALTAGK